MERGTTEQYLEKHLPRFLDFLKQMVGINSYTLNKEGIDRLSDLTASAFEKFGFSSRKVPSADSRFGSHLILEKKGRIDNTTAFISHLDTVYSEEEESRNRFAWKVEGDRIYGPGTVDIKGGTMMIYILMDLLNHFHSELFGDYTFKILLDCAEEVGGADFGDLCHKELDSKNTLACLVFEGSNISDQQHYQVVSRKGMATYSIDVKGRSAHSGTAHVKGANAIVQMARVVERLSSLTDYSNELTVNMGRIEGGTVRNRVADHCRLELEMRAVQLESYYKAIKEIDGIGEISKVESPFDSWACTVTAEREITTPPWERNDRTEGLYEIWGESAEMLGFSMNREIRGGLSDGNLLWQDFPVLDGLGPGGDNSHCSEHNPEEGKEQEYMSLSSVIPVALINVSALISLLEKNLSV